ncbi:MAG: RNA polymerase sigma factor SigZ [Nitrospira sp.]|nr:MAG: RNA polymerase sigma factor SigZ [Nitrospira sp.]
MSQQLAVHNPERYSIGYQTQGAILTKTTEELWQLMHDGLRIFIAKRVTDQGHVDDILQEVFVRVHRQIDSVKDPERLVSWVYQITRNAIIDHYRKPGRQREVPAGLSSELEVLHESPIISGMIHDGDGAEPRAELACCLRPMIEQLSQDYRDAITLVEIEGLPQHAAAEQMGISLSGMKSRVQRGRKQLKQMLDACCMIELDRRGGVVDFDTRAAGCDCCADRKDQT